MKSLDLYTLRLVKDNILYFVFLTLFILVIVISTPLFVSGYVGKMKKKDVLKQEIFDLNTKKAVILSYKADQAEELITLLNTLIPSKEDYFSVFSALETISNKSGFRILGYKANLKNAKKGQFALLIEGEGSTNSFIQFLTSYAYSGGRLITIEKAEAKPANTKNSILLTFYSFDPQLSDTDKLFTIDKTVAAEVSKAKQVIPRLNEQDAVTNVSGSIGVRPNPFGQ